ncbi:lipopolysaccharide assembly protein LapB [Salinivibrio sp. MA351]|jgi:lipopolysaccharide biosynthesis regulator YciM|uniref:Lipopolysaccharide assembly protein B n=1 Tax=Salinivibrio costicola subsp. alcaliphilus TaxID=272773 RepID=A0ABX3KPA2_SALCS|nr:MULTISPECIES: lipopolysaccharide assembly protein LapB [Salinivibrio]NUY55580.1 lipopolysaccharide assembly protein LapB [Salinivibrio sp. EAGSL]OOE93840.1 lipopolysaccharide assembly protein LapB [Salinivibrio sp. AR647]OOE95790.1 lipopolysaccharide assembly protein LapB [Salinivibrio sp. AR640]OOE98533.1 lipopolysaccharide assembly protein LapB [Salinivibrio sp. MA351]OOE99583.1 lipopolysaccharide assembly protein LapB [Salinivibrio sp. IB643]
MLELLFLLLPIAAGYGWYMGNRNARHRRQEQSHHLSRQYVAGLNLLLSEQSDKAVDLFIELLQVDNETIDTHLALGNLFRSRGEVDRAIRIHQNLIARPNLTLDQRNLAMQQLAKDYMVAGFFDRAEKIFAELVDEPDYREFALQQLLAISQQTREWEQAIDTAAKLVKMGKHKLRKDIAHFHCELAMQQLAEGDEHKARQLLRRALSYDKSCVRASLKLARLDIQHEDYKGALKQLENILEQDADFVSEALPLLAESYRALGREMQLVRFLKECIEKNAGVSAELMLSEVIGSNENIAMAQSFLTRQLTRNPTMRGFYKLMEYHVEQAEEGRAKASLNTLKGLVAEQMKVKPHYRCRKCGFSTHALYWQCPSCKSWGAIKPIRGLDGE